MDSDQDGTTAGTSTSKANDDVTPEAVIDSDDDVTFPLSYELFNSSIGPLTNKPH